MENVSKPTIDPYIRSKEVHIFYILLLYRRRLVYKNGECNVSHKHIRKVKRHYLADIFTTLIDLKWRWSLIIFVMTFTLTWLLFALLWWIIGLTHGDFNEDRPDDHKPCMDNVYDFPTAFLFSLETQHTIGYGGRAVTSECPGAVIMIMIQSITGVLVQALMTGMSIVPGSLQLPDCTKFQSAYGKRSCTHNNLEIHST